LVTKRGAAKDLIGKISWMNNVNELGFSCQGIGVNIDLTNKLNIRN